MRLRKRSEPRKIKRDNRVIIPPTYRDELEIFPGTSIIFSTENGNVFLKKFEGQKQEANRLKNLEALGDDYRVRIPYKHSKILGISYGFRVRFYFDAIGRRLMIKVDR